MALSYNSCEDHLQNNRAVIQKVFWSKDYVCIILIVFGFGLISGLCWEMTLDPQRLQVYTTKQCSKI